MITGNAVTWLSCLITAINLIQSPAGWSLFEANIYCKPENCCASQQIDYYQTQQSNRCLFCCAAASVLQCCDFVCMCVCVIPFGTHRSLQGGPKNLRVFCGVHRDVPWKLHGSHQECAKPSKMFCSSLNETNKLENNFTFVGPALMMTGDNCIIFGNFFFLRLFVCLVSCRRLLKELKFKMKWNEIKWKQ